MSSEGGYKGKRERYKQQADENERNNRKSEREDISDI